MAETDSEIIIRVRKTEQEGVLARAMQMSLNDEATQAELDALTAHIEGCTPAPEPE